MWRQVALTAEVARAEAIADWLVARGALSVSLDDAEDQPLFEPPPGAMPLWDKTIVTGLFEPDLDPVALIAEARRLFGPALQAARHEVLEDQAWERAWMAHFRPMQFGRMWVCPSGYDPPDPLAVTVHLDPGLAFGTGTHPTTALCLRWLAAQNLATLRVLDYGCGSGILAVSALCLGAGSAVGVDIDPQALEATRDNAQKNQVGERLLCQLADTQNLGRFDLIVANILAGPLVSLAPVLAERLRPGGSLGLSGILVDQAAEVRSAYAPYLDFDADEVEEGWVLLKGRRLNAEVPD